MSWDVPDVALRTAAQVSQRVAKSHRQIVPQDELLSVCYEWIASHKRQTLEWSQREGDRNALYTSMMRATQQYVLTERTRNGALASDQYFYHLAVVEALLPDVWDVEMWVNGSGDQPEGEQRGKTMPSEGGTRQASLADLSRALRVLNTEEEQALRLKYEQGCSLQEIATRQDVSIEGARKRVARSLMKLIDCLGGEAPWELAKRVPRGNKAGINRASRDYEGGAA